MYLLWCVKLKLLSFIRKDCVSVATIIKFTTEKCAFFRMPPRRRRVRAVREYRKCCQILVKNVVDTFRIEKEQGRLVVGLTRTKDRACRALGISGPTLCKLMKDDITLQEPCVPELRARGMFMDEDDIALIRPALVSLVIEKQPVTLDSLLQRIKNDNPNWKWSRVTLYRALRDRCGIVFTTRRVDKRYYEKLHEDPANVLKRANYLKYFFQYEHDK